MKKGLIIDVLVVVAVLAAAVGIGVRFMTDASKNAKEGVALRYVLEIEGVRIYSVNAINKKGGVYNEKDKSHMGDIVSVDYTASTTTEVDSEGNVINAEVPDKYNAIVTVEAVGHENANDYFVGENTELSVGTTLYMTTKYANTSGRVMSIEKLEK